MKTQEERQAVNFNELEMRVEALRVARDVASHNDGIGNVLVHALWALKFLKTGQLPAVDEVND